MNRKVTFMPKGKKERIVQQALPAMTEVQLKALKAAVLRQVEAFYRERPEFKQIRRKDIRTWAKGSLTERRLTLLRDQIILERYADGDGSG